MTKSWDIPRIKRSNREPASWNLRTGEGSLYSLIAAVVLPVTVTFARVRRDALAVIGIGLVSFMRYGHGPTSVSAAA
jgi:hypothetical protein